MAQVVLSPIGQPMCAWSQDSRKYAIQVHADVLGRLGMEVRVAFKRVPRRGLEVGGILLGRTERRDDTTTFWIEGFEPVESEHRSGPSYILSDPDFNLLKEALTKKGAASIGIFRSQTRSQRLLLEEADGKLFERCFADGEALLLLACPVSAKAAFFVRESGEMKCVYEFGLGSPLAPGVAAQGLPSPETEGALDPAAEIQPALLTASRSSPPAGNEDTEGDSVPLLDQERRPGMAIGGNRFGRALGRGLDKPRSGWTGRSAGFKKGTWLVASLLFSACLGVGMGVFFRSRPASVPPQALSEKDLHLTVEVNGVSLRLQWDQNALGIGNPSRAVLHIQDGEYQMVRNLAPSEFKAGSVAYEPRSRDVSFRVEVFSPTATASGSVQVVNLPQAALPPVWPAGPAVRPPASYAATELPAGKSTAGPSESGAPAAIAEKMEDIRPSAVKSSDGSDGAAVVRRELSPRADLAREPKAPVAERAAGPVPVPEPTVRVWPEALVGSSWGRLVGKVPLVRRLRKTVKISTPTPIIQAQPVLTDPVKQSITRPVSVEVRVDVGESGIVESAELVEFSDPLNVAVTNSALAAAVRWTFEPARSDEVAVPSKVILHFRFTP